MPVRRSLVRPKLKSGMEHKAYIGLQIIAALFIVVIPDVKIKIAGVVIYMIGVVVLRRLASGVDPHAFAILARHYRYKRSYKPNGTPWVSPKPAKRFTEGR